MTPVGKLDRKALPTPSFERRTVPYAPPTNNTERTVVDIFETVLGHEHIGVDDDFFELGGTSIVATRITIELEKRLGMRVPLQSLFLDPTPAGVARAADGMDAHSPDDSSDLLAPMITLRAGSDRAPLFFVHPGIGLSWGYAEFVKHLELDQPVYGLQLTSLSGGPSFDSLTELADDYANRIAAVASTGPIHLAGWSLGGVIAHAVAHSLTRSGRDVTLSILDSYPSSDSDQPAELSVSELLAGLAMPAGSKTVETFEEAAELLEQTLGAGIGIEAEHLARISRGYSHSVELTNRHQPPVHVGAIEFFVAGRSTENGHDVAEWRRFVEGDIRVTEVDCEHNQMIEPGPAATIAVRLREVIAQWGV